MIVYSLPIYLLTLISILGLLRSAGEDAQNILRDSGRGFVGSSNGFSPAKATVEGVGATDFYGSGMDYEDMVNESYNENNDNKS